jgi:hypothetical protein
MAGEWIKMRGNLWDDPRVSRICDMTGQSEAAIVGALYWLWATADQHTEDGSMPGLSLRQIDRKTGVEGFGAALVAINWLRDDAQGVVIVGFDEHNGTSAKKRCQTAKRVAAFKAGNGPATHEDKEGNAESVTKALAERDLEKRREEEELSKASPSHPSGKPDGKKTPTVPCPYEAIVEAYHELLPSMPRVQLRDGPTWTERQRAMRTVWAWVLSSKRPDGSRRAESADDALSWLRDYFAQASENDFLMGRTERSGKHKNWRCDLDFLLTTRGMKQVIEKTQDAA